MESIDDWEVIDTITIINDLKRQFDTSDNIEQKKIYLVNIFENIQLILKDSSVILNEEKYIHFYNNYLKRDGIIWNMMKTVRSDVKFSNELLGLYTTINNAWNKKKNTELKSLPKMPVPPMRLPVPPKGDPRDRIKKGGKSKKKIQIIKKSKKYKKSMNKKKMKTKTYKNKH